MLTCCEQVKGVSNIALIITDSLIVCARDKIREFVKQWACVR